MGLGLHRRSSLAATLLQASHLYFIEDRLVSQTFKAFAPQNFFRIFSREGWHSSLDLGAVAPHLVHS